MNPWAEFAYDAIPYLLVVACAAGVLVWAMWQLQKAGRNQ